LLPVKTPDLEVDAERLYALSQAYRTAKKEAEMFTVAEYAGAELSGEQMERRWADGRRGNYHWVELEREKKSGCRNISAYWIPFRNGKHAF